MYKFTHLKANFEKPGNHMCKVQGLKANCETQAQELKPGAFKLWVNCIQQLYSPALASFSSSPVTGTAAQ
jgi:hypothetical protein